MTLRLTPQAHEALLHLRDDPTRTELYRAVARSLHHLGAPTDVAFARPEHWQTPWGQAWAVPITTDHDRWLAVYQHDTNKHPTVLHLGPHPDAAHP